MLSLLEKVFFLKTIDLFATLDEHDLAQLAGAAEDLAVAPGNFLFQEHDPGDGLYIVLDGEVSILLADREINVMRPGDCFGEIAILGSVARTAGARAKTDCYLLRLGRAAFQDLFGRRPSLRQAVLRQLARRRLAIEQRLARTTPTNTGNRRTLAPSRILASHTPGNDQVPTTPP